MKTILHAEQPVEEWRAGVTTRMHVSAINGAAQLCIFEQWVAPEKGAPTHSHPVEEVLSVISGQADIWLGDESALLTGGQSVVVPAGQKHGFRNVGVEVLHIHAVLASSVFDATFDGDKQVRRWFSN